MKNSIKTVTVGIAAYNEEKRIGQLLKSLLLQKQEKFALNEILVVSDGSSDKTEEIVKKMAFKNKKIKLLKDGKRLGKNARLNQIYRMLKSDILVSFDADIEIKDRHLIEKMAQEFEDKKVGLVGGNVIHTSKKTLVGKIVLTQEKFWEAVKYNINSGNNVHTHTGPISAARKSFLKKVVIPANLPDDHYLYFAAKKLKYSYKFQKDANVYVKSPSTMEDYIKQQSRFLDSASNLRKHFGKSTEKEYAIERSIKLKAYLAAFVENPVYLTLSIGLVFVQKVFAVRYTKSTSGTWVQVASSK